MRRSFIAMVVLCLAVAGCRAVDLSPSTVGTDASVRVIEGEAGDGGTDGGLPGMPLVAFLEPMDGASFTQRSVVDGEWAAEVTFRVDALDVARTELTANGSFVLGDLAADGTLTYAFMGEGLMEIVAVGYDDEGVELARDMIEITIDPPGDTSCHAMLDGLGIDWSVAGPSRGIADPVRVEPVINGVRFRYVSNTNPTAMTMDCDLAVRLHRMTEVLVPYGIDEVIHIGIYNYRCIGGGDPDSGTCTPSQHAYARAIDIHAFGAADSDVEYNTEFDWVITERGDQCPIDSFNDEDRVLKEIACQFWAMGIYQVILTPNYNVGHRNHFHVDLSEGSMFIGQSAAGIDPVVGEYGH